MIDFHLGDCVKWANEYEGELFHALLCDPPYHLTSIVKRFGKEGSAPVNNPRVRANGKDMYSNLSRGFMNQQWDGGDVAFRPETWAAFANVLHPGAFGFAFASSRGWHRLAVAIEDAGLIIHPSMFGWAFGSGFPKATRVDTQIDKRKGGMGLTLEVVKYLREKRDELKLKNKDIDAAFGFNGMAGHWTGFSQPEIPRLEYWQRIKELLQLDERFDDAITAHEREVVGTQTKARSTAGDFAMPTMGADVEYKEWDITAPATPLAQAFAGHRYGLQALKPALEPIIVFQVPYAGRPIDCITATGAGCLNVDGGRIGTTGSETHSANAWGGEIYGEFGAKETVIHNKGRWPANFYLDEEAARRLDEQSGERGGGTYKDGVKRDRIGFRHHFQGNGSVNTGEANSPDNYGDSGGASRFFFNVREQIDEADAVRYQAKASRRERDAGLDGMEEIVKGSNFGNNGARPHTSPDYVYEGKTRNPHPTVKPLNLTKYLATLLLPPAEYSPRRLFVPFAGVGSEAIGAMQAGWEHVEGIEITDEYIPIAQARAEYWTEKEAQQQMVMPL